MASIATVVTRGFGSFGSVNLLPTMGYGAGAVISQDLSMWHATGATSWDQGDGNDIAPQFRRNTDIAQVIQASGEQT